MIKFNSLSSNQRIIDAGSSGCGDHPGHMIRTNGNQIMHEKHVMVAVVMYSI